MTSFHNSDRTRTTVVQMGRKMYANDSEQQNERQKLLRRERHKRLPTARKEWRFDERLATLSDQEREGVLSEKREKKRKCNYNYYSKLSVRQRQRKTLDQEKQVQTCIASEEVSESESIREPDSSFLCRICRRVEFDRRETLLEHVVTHL